MKIPAMRYQRVSKLPTLVLTLTLSLGFCVPTSIANEPAASTTESKAASTIDTKSAPKQTEDQSLTLKEYIQLGMPAYDREWSANDMVTAAKTLSDIAEQGFEKLPRYQSKKSGEFFARITSPENLNMYKNRTLPLDTRLGQSLNFIGGGGETLKVYLYGFLNNKIGADEIIELMGLQLRTIVVSLELVDEFAPTIKKDDPSYATRMQGFDRMKSGLATIVAGTMQTLTERQAYNSTELVRLVGYMKETFPSIVSRLAPGVQQETLVKLETMQKDPGMKDLQPGLTDLYNKVNAVLGKAGS